MKYNLLKTALKNHGLFTEIPYEVLTDTEQLIIKEWKSQKAHTDSPTLKSIAMTLLAAPQAGVQEVIREIANGEELDTASQQIALFKLRTQAILKLTKQISLLEDEKDIAPLTARIVELSQENEPSVRGPY